MRKKYYTYILKFEDNDTGRPFYKTGETNNYERRIAELEYRYNATCTEIFGMYVFKTEDEALTMENKVRHTFKMTKYSRFIPKDRFKGLTDEKVANLQDYFYRKAEEVVRFFAD